MTFMQPKTSYGTEYINGSFAFYNGSLYHGGFPNGINMTYSYDENEKQLTIKEINGYVNNRYTGLYHITIGRVDFTKSNP